TEVDKTTKKTTAKPAAKTAAKTTAVKADGKKDHRRKKLRSRRLPLAANARPKRQRKHSTMLSRP
ncbi:hypothetical protein Lpp71_10013, partial [Lacticaseibacillus paracasei subsp. paracasei Lpp71]